MTLKKRLQSLFNDPVIDWKTAKLRELQNERDIACRKWLSSQLGPGLKPPLEQDVLELKMQIVDLKIQLLLK